MIYCVFNGNNCCLVQSYFLPWITRLSFLSVCNNMTGLQTEKYSTQESIVEPRKILKTSPDKKVGGIICFFTDRVNLKLRKLSLSQQCLRSSSLSLSGGGGRNWEARMRPTTDKPPRKNWEWADDPSSELRLDKITLRKTLHWLPVSAQLLPLCLAQLAVCLLLSRYKHIPLHALLVLNFHSRREIKMFYL